MVTAKSHCLRAKVLCTMARYDDVCAAHVEFVDLPNKNEDHTLEEVNLKKVLRKLALEPSQGTGTLALLIRDPSYPFP